MAALAPRTLRDVDPAIITARAYQAFAAGRHTEAAAGVQRVLAESPEDPGALTLAGRLALAAGEPDVAHDIFRRVLDRYPLKGPLWTDLALALRDLGRHSAAADAAARAAGLDDRSPTASVRLGEILLSLNERERANAAFRRALALEPANVSALRGLCQTEAVGAESAVVRQMLSLCESTSLTPTERAGLHYALTQVFRQAGRDEQFLHHLWTANANQRALCPDGRAKYEEIFDRLESAFTPAAFAKVTPVDRVRPTPIFILGMPRSGTTLVEQLLAAHPDVAGGGELDYVRRPLRRAVERATGQPFPERFETIPPQELNAMARAYARRLDLIGDGRAFVTDKTPGNFHVLGLLRILFPQGRIVHVARDPMDTCFSILQYPFDDRSPHTCDVELLAYAYGRYRRLMDRWREKFGDGFIAVEYERLVEAPADEARRLFEYCGLEWKDAYLEFHRAGRAVRTFSTTQVRQPIYRTSVGAWRRYETALEPLARALRSELQIAAQR